MFTLAQCTPPLPGYSGMRTHAPYPVWSGSITKAIRFQPMPKKVATRLWHRARDFDRNTRKPGHHGGAVGHTALQVLHALIFDFMNYATGRLDPSYAAIARKANVCERSVANALKRLRELGILSWVRRCTERWLNGRFVLEQQTNAYAVMPSSQWRGYREPPELLAPAPGTWGDHPPLLSVIEQAVLESQTNGDLKTVVGILRGDPGDMIAGALAKLGHAMQMQNSQ